MTARAPDEAAITRALSQLRSFDETELKRFLKGMATPTRRAIYQLWHWQAHGGQQEPKLDDRTGLPWRVWLMMAGRGFGKTRAGAEWVWARAREVPEARIALVGANLDDVAKVMVEGESGLKAVVRADEEVRWIASLRRVDFSTGAQAFALSGERPEKLRGPQHHFAWCDELGKWAHADATWDNLMLGLRLGERPRAVVTTTPQGGTAAARVLKRIKELERCVTTGGRTAENAHLPEDFMAAVTGMYAGTRLGRQELDGEMIKDVAGALWSRTLIEGCRTPPLPTLSPEGERAFARIVVGVDPPAGTDGDACGIVVAGERGGLFYVLADESVAGASPEGWAEAVARAAALWRADRVVAEANQGGRMVESVLRAVERHLPLKLVHASEGKVKRAEPVAALFERGAAKFAGVFRELEDELAGLIVGGGYQGPGRSPDRADACVWALTELMEGAGRAEPRIRLL
nr:terminase family protein [uncultured Sphingosinicella sp.]